MVTGERGLSRKNGLYIFIDFSPQPEQHNRAKGIVSGQSPGHVLHCKVSLSNFRLRFPNLFTLIVSIFRICRWQKPFKIPADLPAFYRNYQQAIPILSIHRLRVCP
jgi:hypothetical protein